MGTANRMTNRIKDAVSATAARRAAIKLLNEQASEFTTEYDDVDRRRREILAAPPTLDDYRANLRALYRISRRPGSEDSRAGLHA
jgi:hypothetical protein